MGISPWPLKMATILSRRKNIPSLTDPYNSVFTQGSGSVIKVSKFITSITRSNHYVRRDFVDHSLDRMSYTY